MDILISIVVWLVFGLVIGALARLLLPGKQQMSLLMTAGLGVVGSFVGGGLAYLFFGSGQGWVQPAGWIMSLIGAIIVLLIYSRVTAAPQG